MDRRTFLFGTAGTAVAAFAGAWALRPADQGAGGHDAYFQRLSEALREHGLGRPTMLVDLDRLDRNTDAVVSAVAPRHYRVVAKSLPSAPLMDHIMKRSGTRRLMVFHQPFLNAVAAAHATADVLIGKPLPVAAAGRFYARHAPGAFDPSRQLQWLIDTPERLRQYAELARGRGLQLQVNVEIDVGLHRGGLRAPRELVEMLRAIEAEPRLTFRGLMGYDPHVAKLPDLLGSQAREFERVQARYRSFLDAWRAHGGGSGEEELLLNAAGSPTYPFWRQVDGIANDISAGSGLVKPLDFDLDSLSDLVPALFVATPVLKAWDGLHVPGFESVGRLQRLWNPNRARTFFVYGGYWMARPVSPPGLSENPIFGHSTNQEMLNGSARVELGVDDYVFYRPTQSEFVMLQFGEIAAVRGGRIIDFWAPLDQRA